MRSRTASTYLSARRSTATTNRASKSCDRSESSSTDLIYCVFSGKGAAVCRPPPSKSHYSTSAKSQSTGP
jgi:hypothetical protein